MHVPFLIVIIGEALYRFLLSQSSTPPTFHLHVRGTHPETKVRFSNSGSSQQRLNDRLRTETYTEIATDFDFRIDLTPNVLTQPTAIQWSVRDDEPAYRGQMYQQVESPSDLIGVLSKSKVKRKELKKYKALCKDRADLGKPPWASTSLSPPQIATQLQSSRTVRQWCDDYCASAKVLKEFVYTKVVYGWDFRKLTSAINSLIVNEAGYTGDLQINFTPEPQASDLIIVRPTTELSRALSNPWIKFFLVITLIYPFIWLFKRFHDKGGGVWKVCGSGYPLKVVRPVPRQEGLLVDIGPSSSPRTTDNLAGEREGVWFKRWELAIRRAVDQKIRSPVPLVIGRSHNPGAAHLDGYNDS